MKAYKNLAIFCLFFECLLVSICEPSCASHIFGGSNGFLVLSDNQTNASNAQNICSISGGSLAQLTYHQSLATFLKKILVTTVSGLSLVTVLESPGFDNVFAYKPSRNIKVNFNFTVDNYVTPTNGRIQKFYVFNENNSFPQYTQELRFCFNNSISQTVIRTYCESSLGYYNQFSLYGGTSITMNAIELYNYVRAPSKERSTNLFLDRNNIPDGVIDYGRKDFPNVIIPDISVFIGAQSDVNQKNWFWNNGTIVNNPIFPTLDESVCQQMTWPLTYDDGVNLRLKECDAKNYFLCHIEFEIAVSPVKCSGTQLNISWNNIDLKQITNRETDWKVDIYANNSNITRVSFSNMFVHLRELQERSFYIIKAVVRTSECLSSSSSSFSSSVFTTTSFGIPLPVENARILNTSQNSSDCVIEWPYLDEQFDNIDYYEITNSIGYENKLYTSFLKPTTGGFLQHEVDLSQFDGGMRLKFQIQAFSCEGGNKAKDVSGSCLVPSSPHSPPGSTDILISVVVSTVAFILLLSLFIAFIIFRKRINNKNDLRESSNLNHNTNFDLDYVNSIIPSTKNDESPYMEVSNTPSDAELVKSNLNSHSTTYLNEPPAQPGYQNFQLYETIDKHNTKHQ